MLGAWRHSSFPRTFAWCATFGPLEQWRTTSPSRGEIICSGWRLLASSEHMIGHPVHDITFHVMFSYRVYVTVICCCCCKKLFLIEFQTRRKLVVEPDWTYLPGQTDGSQALPAWWRTLPAGRCAHTYTPPCLWSAAAPASSGTGSCWGHLSAASSHCQHTRGGVRDLTFTAVSVFLLGLEYKVCLDEILKDELTGYHRKNYKVTLFMKWNCLL